MLRRKIWGCPWSDSAAPELLVWMCVCLGGQNSRRLGGGSPAKEILEGEQQASHCGTWGKAPPSPGGPRALQQPSGCRTTRLASWAWCGRILASAAPRSWREQAQRSSAGF